MRAKALFLSVGVATLLSLTGCGGDSSQKTDVDQTVDSKSMLNADNYLNLAKYYYLQESRSRSVMKSRSMEHLKNARSSSEQGTFYIKSNKNSDDVITSLIIKNSDALVSVMIDDKSKSVTVSLHGVNSDSSKTLSLAEFSSFDVDESVESEGEVK